MFNDIMTFQPGDLTGTFATLQGGGDGNSVNLPGGLTLQANYNNAAGNISLDVISTPPSVNPAVPVIAPTTIKFGNVRINTTQQQALSVTNMSTTPPQASLDAQISVPTSGGGAATASGGPINQLAPGSTSTSLVAGLNTMNAGAQSGTATVALQSDSTPNGCTSNCVVDLTPQNIAVSGNVFRLANPVINTTPVSLAARVGDTAPSQTVTISNSSPDVFTEGLNASFGTVSSPFSPSGSIANLAAQGTSTALSVALATGTAGSFSGMAPINFISTGAGTDNAPDISVGSQNVSLTGNVYTPAVANVLTTSPVDFGIVHVGDGGGSLAQSVAVQNGATATALNDVLTGSISAGGSPFSGSGTLGAGLEPQGSSSARSRSAPGPPASSAASPICLWRAMMSSWPICR